MVILIDWIFSLIEFILIESDWVFTFLKPCERFPEHMSVNNALQVDDNIKCVY